MTEDRFLARIREDAEGLRYEPAGDFVTTGLAARIRERIERPTVAELLASWFRPVAASLSALALAATLALALLDRNNADVSGSDSIEVSMGGDVYSVGE
jgi:hypothetical protein